MNNIIRKSLILLSFVVASISLSACGNSGSDETSNNDSKQPFSIILEAGDISETLVPLYADGEYSVYLPTYVKSAKLDIIADDGVYINDVAATDAEDLLQDGVACILKLDNKEYTLNVYESSNVGTVFITTASGKMDDIYANPTYKEQIDIAVFTADGTLDYQNSEDKLKLRGNSTKHLDKKPFGLKLDEEASILGLRPAKNFALLANGYDQSGLRDVLYKKLSADTEFDYEIGTEYVDVYLNGEYNGLYTLSEKIIMSEDGLDLKEGDYLCSIELTNNMKEDDVYVDSNIQDIFEICFPEEPSDEEISEIKEHLDSLECALTSEDGKDSRTGKAWNQLIDLESWAKGYIIDEVSANTDSSLASSYFYYKSADGVFYKGPIWDGDRTLGNQGSNGNPETLIASQGHGYAGKLTVYYSYLLQKEEFRDKVKEVYGRYDFQSLLNNHVSSISASIAKAKDNDSHRWESLYQEVEADLECTVCSVEDIKTYVSARVQYLNKVIPNYEDYAVIYIYDEGYKYETVKKGGIYTPEDSTAEYINIDTGEIVDFSKPVYENIAVTK